MITRMNRQEFIQRWKRAVEGSAYAPQARGGVYERLVTCFEKLTGELTCTDRAGEARTAGAVLAPLHDRFPELLTHTLRLLPTELPAIVDDVPAERIHAALGELAAGYVHGLKEQLTEENRTLRHGRDAAESLVQSVQAREQAMFGAAPLGIALVGISGVIEEVNPALPRIFRRTAEQLVGESILDLADEGWHNEVRGALADLADGALERTYRDVRFTTPTDEHVWVQLTGALVRDADDEPDYLVLLYEDITNQHMLQERFRKQNVQDALTGLGNRSQLESRMDAALTPVYPGRRVGLCYFDLDGFKAVNNSVGHQVGDRMLRIVANRLQAMAVAESAVAARIGGDEFAVLVPDSFDCNTVVDLVERLQLEIARPIWIGPHELHASASVGIVECEVAGTHTEAMLRNAEIALHQAKSEGRALWVQYDPARGEGARADFMLAVALPAALDKHETFVEYEPIVDADERITGLAARVCWDHEDLGELPAGRFLSIAEEAGLGARLGAWVLEQACEHAARWCADSGAGAPGVWVGLSARHCREPELVADVRDILQRTELPPEALTLGLPISVLFDHQGDPVDTLRIFADLGIRLVGTGFGADFSGLSRLRGLPLSGVLLDAPVPDPGDPDPLEAHAVHSAVSAARLLDFPVHIRNVHTEAQAGWLRRAGVDLLQGDAVGERLAALEVADGIGGGGHD